MRSITSPIKQSALSSILRARQAALPAEHGAWVFLFSPLVIGLALGGFRPVSFLFVGAALAAFLIRQPLTMVVKVFSRRRPKHELPGAVFWMAVYGVLGAVALVGLLAQGYGFLAWLAAPALPVFMWHLWLVSRRAERRQMLIEIVASGVLALAAPGAYWVGRGQVDPTGWLLWGLAWLQVAGTILYAYLRLRQRSLKAYPTREDVFAMARWTFLYHIAALLLVVGLAAGRVVPALVPLAFTIQLVEVAWGTLHPAVGVKPKVIGIRQLIISCTFTAVFVLTWAVR